MFMVLLKRTIFVFMALLQVFLCVHGPLIGLPLCSCSFNRTFFVFIVLLQDFLCVHSPFCRTLFVLMVLL